MPTSSARITLYLSGDEKIIALPSGTGRRWAETALDLAGFTQNHDLIHTLPLDDQARARQALTHLHQAARDCQVSVATHPRPYLGDIAEAIAVALPDHWQADVLDLREPQDQHYLRDYLWETGSLYTLLDTKPLGFAAILRDGGGTELLLVERPSDGSYMVGALTPSPDHLHATAPAPRSVIASDAQLAARFIQSRLLPDYERAVHLSRLHEVEQDLRWAQEAHEPGTYPTVESQAALYRFRTHAAQGRRREGAEVFERHVAPHANTLLAAARSAVDAMPPARHHAAWRELIDDMAHAADQIRSIRSAPASQPEPDASRVRHLQLWPYVLAWAERSFIISDLAGQHRPVAPP
ncbi:hypothetical protein DN402_09150 [Streptomyces sp. SW4]|nr:hypothetical protein DN402_09150 [Streptomyces sp. SW4]